MATPETLQALNEFIARESKTLENLTGSNAFGNFPIPVGTHYEFFTAVYIQRKAELIIMSTARGDQVLTDSELVRMFMNRKVLTDLGRFSSSLVHLLQDAEIREFMQEHEFHKRDPNSTFCADLMEAFTGSDPAVKNVLEIEREKLDTECEWFFILPHRQQYQCLLKALAGIMWLQSHSIFSYPCTQAQAERTVIIGKFLSNTAGLEPTTYIEWLKGG